MADHHHFSSASTSNPSIANPSRPRFVDFTPRELQRLQTHHSLSVYAKILGRRVGYEHFSSHIRILLHPRENLDVVSLANGYFLLKFYNPLDYEDAIGGGPWTINNHYIVLIPWVPNFKPSESSITKAKVWIRLYELPVEYYHVGALSRIAEAIAPLVKIDHVTENMTKCKFARFCVELDLQNPLPDSAKLPNGFWQPVRYEGLRSLQCYGCRRVGHVQRDCPGSNSLTPQHIPSEEAVIALGNQVSPGDW